MWNSTPSPGFKYRPKLKIWTDGQNNKFYEDTVEATSYGWWTYVAKIKGKVVFNAYPYSHTTQNHQRNMRDLLKRLKIKIDVEVSMRQSLSNFSVYALGSLYTELARYEIDMARGLKKGVYSDSVQKHFDTRAEAIKAVKESIKACRQLGAKMKRSEIRRIKIELLDADKRRLEKARIKRAETKLIRDQLTPKLRDLGPISLDVFEKIDNLDEIKI